MGQSSRQSFIYVLVLIAVAYLSITILSKSLRYPAKPLAVTAAIPMAPAKPNVINDTAIAASKSTPAAKALTTRTAPAPGVEVAEKPLTQAFTATQHATPTAMDNQPRLLPKASTKTRPLAVTTQASQPAPQPEALIPSTTDTSANTHQGWAVRVGTFAKNQLAAKIISELDALGYPVFSQTVTNTNNKRPLTVVYVGPEVSKLEADDLRAELQVMEDLKGKVVFIG